MSSSSLFSNGSRPDQTAVSAAFKAWETTDHTFVFVGEESRSLAAATSFGDKARNARAAARSINSLFDERKVDNADRSSLVPIIARPRKLARSCLPLEVSLVRLRRK